MARIRTIKPEFWTSEQVMELSPVARLLFIGLWNFCDDAGIHPANLKTLKAQVFPCDDIDVGPLVDAIMAQGLVLEYEVGGKDYWHVTGWNHQKIDKPTFKYPLPNGVLPQNHDDVRRAFDEYSARTQRVIGDDSTSVHPRKGRYEEGKGEYAIGRECRGKPASFPSPPI